MKTFTEGQTVYDTEGREYCYVGQTGIDKIHIVRPLYDGGDYEDESGSPICIEDDSIFGEPPIVKKHEEIAKLDAEIELKQGMFATLRSDLFQSEAKQKQAMQRLKKVPDLSRLADILEGKATHYFVDPGYRKPYIIAAKDAKRSDEHHTQWERKMRAMVFKVSLDKDGERCWWELTEYNDGSGSGTKVRIHFSHEEAVADAKAWADAEIEQYRKELAENKTNRSSRITDAAELLKSAGLLVPEDISEALRKRQLSSLEAAVKERQKNLDADTAALRDFIARNPEPAIAAAPLSRAEDIF
jgi:hypothetical protein